MKEKKEYKKELLVEEINEHHLILFNDDVNSFDHVINCLVEICGHSSEQAEQCAWIVHNKGKYGVKSGSFHDLKLMCEKLCVEGLSATVE